MLAPTVAISLIAILLSFCAYRIGKRIRPESAGDGESGATTRKAGGGAASSSGSGNARDLDRTHVGTGL